MLEHALTVAAAKAKIAGLVIAAAAIGGTAAVTAAGSSTFLPTGSDTAVTSDATPNTDGEATEATTTEATPNTDGEATETTPELAPTTAVVCPEGLKNHGEYVSSVAKDKSTQGREHGVAVSEAAHSDCGKSAKDADATEAEEADEVEAPESPESADDEQSDDSAGTHAKKQKHSKKHR